MRRQRSRRFLLRTQGTAALASCQRRASFSPVAVSRNVRSRAESRRVPREAANALCRLLPNATRQFSLAQSVIAGNRLHHFQVKLMPRCRENARQSKCRYPSFCHKCQFEPYLLAANTIIYDSLPRLLIWNYCNSPENTTRMCQCIVGFTTMPRAYQSILQQKRFPHKRPRLFIATRFSPSVSLFPIAGFTISAHQYAADIIISHGDFTTTPMLILPRA